MAAPTRKTTYSYFAWGANTYGQLGHGHNQDLAVPTRVEDADITGDQVYMSGGGGHSFIISGKKEVLACGQNSKGQLGVGHCDADVDRFLRVPALDGKNVVKLVGGWDFSVALTENGDVYTWGSNTFSQLGLTPVKDHTSVPEKLEVGKSCYDIGAGMRHAVLVSGTGEVYTWGIGKKGQLGQVEGSTPLARATLPQQVKLPDECGKPTQCVAGAYHTAILTDKGQVVMFGDNKHGQLCTDPKQESQKAQPYVIPSQCMGGKKIVEIHSGWTHLLALTGDHEVLSWGRADYGQLGRQCAGSFDHVPGPVKGLGRPGQLACGSEHNLAINENGEIVSWGWNEHGICGTGDEENVLEPQVVPALKNYITVQIGCGNGHSMAVCRER